MNQAVRYASQALDIDPNFGIGMAVLGEAYSRVGRLEEGIALLERGRQLVPGEYWPTGFLGCAYVRGGRRSETERLLVELKEKRSTAHR